MAKKRQSRPAQGGSGGRRRPPRRWDSPSGGTGYTGGTSHGGSGRTHSMAVLAGVVAMFALLPTVLVGCLVWIAFA